MKVKCFSVSTLVETLEFIQFSACLERIIYPSMLCITTVNVCQIHKILFLQLLYRCVQGINQTHDDAHVQMDVKLRSLICMGLNEQVLHLWLEVLCSCADIVQKWFVIFQSILRTSEKTCALNFSLISCLFYFPKGIIHGVSYSVQDGYKLSVNFGFCLNLHSV